MATQRDDVRASHGEPVYTVEEDLESDSLVAAIVSAIVKASPDDPEPVVRDVDVVAVRNLLASVDRGRSLRVEFDLSHYRVVVERDDRVEVTVTQEFCIDCGRSLDSGEWHPAATDRDEGSELTYYLFCDERCRGSWQGDRERV